MKILFRIILCVICIWALAVIGSVFVSAAFADTDVTANATIQADLAMAVTFWDVEQPTLTPPCSPESVVFTTNITDAYGANGILYPASAVWAETGIDSCTILLSQPVYDMITEIETGPQWELCIVIAHEYGHTLGLPDETSIPMMSNNWGRYDDPLCEQYVHGWGGTLEKDRKWLAAHHLVKPHRKGVAP